MNNQIVEALKDFKFPRKLVVLVTGGRTFAKYPEPWRGSLRDPRYDKLFWKAANEADLVQECLYDIAQLHDGTRSWFLETYVVYNDLVVVQGLAEGADAAAKRWADKHCKPENNLGFPAEWERHGRSAGSIRNQRMHFETQPHLVLAFPGGMGTANMVSIAERSGTKVIKVESK